MWNPKTPYLAVDGIIRYRGGIVLIERKFEPRGFALPGGFVEVGEDVTTALRREMKEETNLEVEIKAMLGVYSNPKRDPRFHVVSLVFVCDADESQNLMSGDDAKKVYSIPPNDIKLDKLVFDHAQIITDYLRWIKEEKNDKSKSVFIR